MQKDRVTFSFRMSEEDAARIDEIRRDHGFGTRSKFLTAAGLAYGKCDTGEQILQRLAGIAFELHRFSSESAPTKVLSESQITELRREIKKTMRAVRDRLPT